MNKQYITIILLLIVCSILSFSLLSKESNAVSLECNDTNVSNSTVTDFDALNYMDSFDVSDLGEMNINTIDIASKSYAPSTISVVDSDFKISDELLTNIYSTINNYGAANSFYIISLTDGMSVGYNVDTRFETASSVKAPYALYIYKEIDAGNIDPNQEIVYEEKYYNKGTGVIKKSDFGTIYTVRDLVYYSLFESDNIAHAMLHKNFGVKGYNNMLSNLGTKQLYLTAGNPWGYTSSRSAALVWQEIYNFSIKSDEGITFLNILSNGKYNYFKEVMPSIPSASKTGFASKDVVETGIVFGDKPYIAIAMANKGGSIGAYTQVLKLVSHMNDIMNEYDAYMKTK